MSVIVEGMEMPDSCEKCKLDLRTDACRAFDEWHKEHPYSIRATDRLPDCPLVALPEEHGDLIDRNALKKDYRMGNDCERCETDWKSCQYDRVYSKMDFCEWIDDAPVVIEAEGEE